MGYDTVSPPTTRRVPSLLALPRLLTLATSSRRANHIRGAISPASELATLTFQSANTAKASLFQLWTLEGPLLTKLPRASSHSTWYVPLVSNQSLGDLKGRPRAVFSSAL